VNDNLRYCVQRDRAFVRDDAAETLRSEVANTVTSFGRRHERGSQFDNVERILASRRPGEEAEATALVNDCVWPGPAARDSDHESVPTCDFHLAHVDPWDAGLDAVANQGFPLKLPRVWLEGER